MDEKTPLDRACEALGGTVKLAEALGIKAPSISEWRARGKVPAERCLEIEKLTGVSRYELREDVYGSAPTAHRKPTRTQARASA